MKDEKIREVYDGFRLDDSARKEVLQNIRAEARKIEEKPVWRRSGFKKAAVAACAVMILAFGTVAYALGWFGLKDLSTGKNDRGVTMVKNGKQEQVMRESEILSLGGLKGTPEYQAFAEWEPYRWNYLKEHRDELNNDPVKQDGYYTLYDCWFPEMKENLDEILAKYDLKPHEKQQFYENARLQEICEDAGIETLFPDTADRIWDYGCYAYTFDDGSFHLESNYDIGAEELLEFGMTRCVYGSFNDIGINAGNTDRFTEWQFTTPEGVCVTVAEIREAYTDAYGREHGPGALVLIGRQESMVTVSISSWVRGYYLIDGVRYTDEDLPEGVVGTPEDHFWDYELPSREQIQEFVTALHAELIP